MKLFQNFEEILSDPNVWFIPGFILVIALEIYYTHKHHMEDVYEAKDTFANLNMGMGSLIIGVFTKAVWFLIFLFLNKFSVFHFAPDQWYAWVLLLFADDFTFYWFHRAAHQIRILWADHSNHHSSQKYNFAVALRQPWIGQFYGYIFWAWLAILGFPAMMIMTMKAISLLYQFFIHTRTVGKLSFLEWFMNTPSHHRVHHAVNIRYLDRNHAGIFIIWDRIFGTFEEEKEEPVFGLTVNLDTYNPLKIALNEYITLWHDVKGAPNLKTKWNYIIKPPGWTHDGELKTSDELRRKAGM